MPFRGKNRQVFLYPFIRVIQAISASLRFRGVFLRSFLQKGTKEERTDYMKIINGVYTSAKIFTDIIEDYALAQIQML